MNQREGESRLDWFDRYAMNEIPIRLIRLSDMNLVGRSDVRKHFRDSVSQYREYYHPFKIAKYAILSHRWLDEGEPAYEVMKSGKAGGPGYEKLKKFCEKAQEYGMEFAWSDTCCIDKNSSTELDESIRSMFRWYRNSYICIIHLAQSETIKDIMDDEWTERGWTLQELLAPKMIKLFNKHWMPMTDDQNDKSLERTAVMKTLEKATGIPLSDLRGLFPGPVSVDKRMKWAAKRKTTRVEDVAYSLMGIFEVSLQIAYGEGGDLAFCRLIEAIMRGGDSSVLNWAGQPAEHRSSAAIPRSPQSFVERALDSPLDLTTSGLLDMTMTSLGLRVPLVIFPLRVTSHTSMPAGPDHVTGECLLCPTIKVNFVARDTPPMSQFALGIVNYSLEEGVPALFHDSAAVILERSRSFLSTYQTFCEPRSRDFVGLKTASHPERGLGRWAKVQGQGLVKVNFPNMSDNSYFHISPEYLKIVYL